MLARSLSPSPGFSLRRSFEKLAAGRLSGLRAGRQGEEDDDDDEKHHDHREQSAGRGASRNRKEKKKNKEELTSRPAAAAAPRRVCLPACLPDYVFACFLVGLPTWLPSRQLAHSKGRQPQAKLKR